MVWDLHRYARNILELSIEKRMHNLFCIICRGKADSPKGDMTKRYVFSIHASIAKCFDADNYDAADDVNFLVFTKTLHETKLCARMIRNGNSFSISNTTFILSSHSSQMQKELPVHGRLTFLHVQ